MNARDAVKWVRSSRPLRRIAMLVAVYVALGLVLSLVSSSRGLLSPGGSPHLDVVALGIAYLLIRIAVRFLVPAVLVYVIAAALVDRLTGE